MAERSVYYFSKMFSEQLHAGDDYRELKKTIVIDILNFELLEKATTYHSVFHLWEDSVRFKLTDVAEFHILELPRLDVAMAGVDSREVQWLLFLKGVGDDMLEGWSMNEPMLKKARTVQEVLSHDREMRQIYEQRRKALLDRTSTENWLKEEQALRQQAEEARGQAEEARGLAEAARLKADKERQVAEAARLKADKECQVAEAARLKADEGRLKAEDERLKADEGRLKADAERQKADAERQKADAERQKADAERQVAEEARLKADAERQKADEERQVAEEARLKADAERQKADEERQVAEEARLKADAERMKADEERMKAEAALDQEHRARQQRARSLVTRVLMTRFPTELTPEEISMPTDATPERLEALIPELLTAVSLEAALQLIRSAGLASSLG